MKYTPETRRLERNPSVLSLLIAALKLGLKVEKKQLELPKK